VLARVSSAMRLCVGVSRDPSALPTMSCSRDPRCLEDEGDGTRDIPGQRAV
jgi:hypothetical protein